MHRRNWLLGFALATMAPCSLYSQAVGSIIGVVTDSSQAVVGNATVTAVQNGTNFTRATKSTATGNFTLPLMPVGSYVVTAEAPGFEKSTANVSLDVDQSQEVDFTLNIGGVQTKVTVEAVTPTIDTTSGEIGGVVQGRQVSNLPLNGRDITNLMLMLPGQTQETNSSFQFQINTSGNGNRGTTGSQLFGRNGCERQRTGRRAIWQLQPRCYLRVSRSAKQLLGRVWPGLRNYRQYCV